MVFWFISFFASTQYIMNMNLLHPFPGLNKSQEKPTLRIKIPFLLAEIVKWYLALCHLHLIRFLPALWTNLIWLISSTSKHLDIVVAMDLGFYACISILIINMALYLFFRSYILASWKENASEGFLFLTLLSKRNFQIPAFHCSSLKFRGLKNSLFWSGPFTGKVEKSSLFYVHLNM